jgi:ABC-2 type transport system permease protein
MLIYRRELRRNILTFIIWTLINLVMSAYAIFAFPNYKASIQNLLDVRVPEPLRNILGMNVQNPASVLGFFSIAAPYLMLFGAIYISNLAGGIYFFFISSLVKGSIPFFLESLT